MENCYGQSLKFASCWGWRNDGRHQSLFAGAVVRPAFTLVQEGGPPMTAPRMRKTPKPSRVSGAFQNQPIDGRPVFTGTENPRHLRVITVLLRRPVSREELDSVAGASNSPELVAELRRRGLTVDCKRILFIDRDGKPCRPGVYSLTEADRRKLYRWMASRQGVTTHG